MTAVTRAGTLSRVMTSWGGTSMVTVLRSTLTILSTIGIRIKSPGPFGPPWMRPSLKMTPLSYSLTILIALILTEMTNIATITRAIAAKPIPTACNKPKVVCIKVLLTLACRVELLATRRPFDGHYLHHPSISKTYHKHLSSCLYNRLLTSRSGFFGGERQLGPPPFTVHEHPPFGFQPDKAPHGAHLTYHPFPTCE